MSSYGEKKGQTDHAPAEAADHQTDIRRRHEKVKETKRALLLQRFYSLFPLFFLLLSPKEKESGRSHCKNIREKIFIARRRKGSESEVGFSNDKVRCHATRCLEGKLGHAHMHAFEMRKIVNIYLGTIYDASKYLKTLFPH